MLIDILGESEFQVFEGISYFLLASGFVVNYDPWEFASDKHVVANTVFALCTLISCKLIF